MKVYTCLLFLILLLLIICCICYKNDKNDKNDKNELDKNFICSYPKDPSILSIKFDTSSKTFTCLTKDNKKINGTFDNNVLYLSPDRKESFTPYKYVPNDQSLILITLGGKNDVHIFNI